MRAEHRNRFARLDHQCFIVFEPAQRRDNRVEGLPASRRASRAAVDNEFVRTLGNLGIEIVHEHAQRGFLWPSLTRNRRASGCADMAAEDAHGRGDGFAATLTRVADEWRAPKASNLKTYGPRCQFEIEKFLT
jgi:hypothetical protein